MVVVSFDSARFLPGCLDSLQAQELGPAEIVVVDSGSSDDSVEIVRTGYPGVDLVDCGENVGFCHANNLGIARTRSPLVLVLNPDTRLAPDFLARLVPAFGDSAVGIATGKLLRFDELTIDTAGQELGRSRQPVDRGYGQRDRGQLDRDADVFGACGAAALYRRSMLESIADPDGCYFDVAFFAFVEDLDLAWRARRLGWKAVYRHEAVGFHARGGSATPGWSSKVAAMLGRSPEIRFHVVKNRYLTILRNDTLGGYLRNLPFIWARDLATLGLVALTSPSVLGRLWKSRGLFREARRRGRLDAARPRHHVP